jgi:hypothetical protein
LAIEQFTGAAQQGRSAFRPLSQLYLSKTLLQKGDVERATAALSLPHPQRSFQGGELPLRLDTVYTDILRDVAGKFQADVVDGGKELDAHPWVYYDFCHFDTAGHRMIAELLSSRLRSILSKDGEAR